MDPISYPHIEQSSSWDIKTSIPPPVPRAQRTSHMDHQSSSCQLSLFLAPTCFPNFLLSPSTLLKTLYMSSISKCLPRGVSGFPVRTLWLGTSILVHLPSILWVPPDRCYFFLFMFVQDTPQDFISLSQTLTFVLLRFWGRAKWLTGNMNLGGKDWKNIDLKMFKWYRWCQRLTRYSLILFLLLAQSQKWHFPVILFIRLRASEYFPVNGRWQEEEYYTFQPGPKPPSDIFHTSSPLSQMLELPNGRRWNPWVTDWRKSTKKLPDPCETGVSARN